MLFSLIEPPTVNLLLGIYHLNIQLKISSTKFGFFRGVFKGFLDQIPIGPSGFWPTLMATDNTFTKYHWRIWN